MGPRSDCWGGVGRVLHSWGRSRRSEVIDQAVTRRFISFSVFLGLPHPYDARPPQASLSEANPLGTPSKSLG